MPHTKEQRCRSERGHAQVVAKVGVANRVGSLVCNSMTNQSFPPCTHSVWMLKRRGVRWAKPPTGGLAHAVAKYRSFDRCSLVIDATISQNPWITCGEPVDDALWETVQNDESVVLDALGMSTKRWKEYKKTWFIVTVIEWRRVFG